MPDISLFDNIMDIEHSDSVPLDIYLQEVKDGRWQDLALNIRTISDKKRRDTMKSALPGVTFAGVFSQRKDACLVQHSGYICIDVDDLGEDVGAIKELLTKDKYVYSVFTSVSGNGLRILFRINGAKHQESYYGISEYLIRNYGLVSDPQSMVPSRSFYVTYDPFLYKASHHVPMFTDYPKEHKIKTPDNFAFAEDDFKSIINQIETNKVNLCEDYQAWLKIGFALCHKFGEDGRNYYHIVSIMSSKYNKRQCDKQYSYCLKHKAMKVATISTFYWYCKQAGLQILSERTQKIRKATLNGKAAGLRKEQIVENLKKENITDSEKIVEEVFDGSNDYGIGESMIEKLEMFITNNYTLRRNEISRYIERFPQRKPLYQSDLNTIFIQAKKVFQNMDYSLMDRLINSDFLQTYNPLQEYFEELGGTYKRNTLPPFDCENNSKFKSPLIDKLAETNLNDDPEFTKYFIRKWLVSVVSSAFKIHSPLILVLVGKQNTGKTEWFRRLFPKELHHYYAESKLDRDKDDEILMCQKLVIMDDEFGGKNKRESDRLKELTSKQVFSLREPYGRSNVDLERIAVLCGTSNTDEILTDTTGNRRIIPITTFDIDKVSYNSIDKTELFKEAYELFNNGFDWRITSNKDINYLNKNSNKHEVPTWEGTMIDKYFAPSDKHDWLNAGEVVEELHKLTNERFQIDKVGRHMKKLGFIQMSKRKDDGKAGLKRYGIMRINRGLNQWASNDITGENIKGIPPDLSKDIPF